MSKSYLESRDELWAQEFSSKYPSYPFSYSTKLSDTYASSLMRPKSINYISNHCQYQSHRRAADLSGQ